MSCENCHYNDSQTGSCTLDSVECVDEDQFVKELEPEDMFKILYMVIYKLGGSIEISVADLAKKIDMQLIPGYDPETKKYVISTLPQPPAEEEPTAILVPKKYLKPKRKRGLIKPSKKLFIPGMN